MLINCTSMPVQTFRAVKVSDVIEKPNNRSGSAFRIKYKGSKYIITAGHICDKFDTLSIQGKPVKVIESVDKEVDICVLHDNPKVDLPALEVNIDPDVQEPVMVDAYHWDPELKTYVRDITRGYILDVQEPLLYPIATVCNPIS